jgi:phosphatidylinositol alpha-mannosyltransferase
MTKRSGATQMKTHLKIGLVFDDSLDRPDGVQQYITAIGEWLAAQGHEVHYLVGETKRTDLPNVHSLSRNVGVRFNGNRLTVPLPAPSTAIKQLLDEQNFDVLHVMMPYSPMMAKKVIMQAPATTTIVGTFHILPQSWLVRWSTHALGTWLGKSLRRFDQVFAVSSSAARFTELAFGVRNVTVLSNVVDVDHFKRAEPFAKYRQKDMLTVMFLGRLVPRKGCIDLLRAIGMLCNEDGSLKKNGGGSASDVAEVTKAIRTKIQVVICGKGPQTAELQQVAERLGIANLVEFTGFVSEKDKPRYYASADVMVFPSTGGESFGIVLIEAMASGRPVVLAASNPGYATVMEPQPGQMFAPGISRELAQLLSHFAGQKEARQAAVVWQREYVQRFDVNAVGQKLVSEYLRLRKQV